MAVWGRRRIVAVEAGWSLEVQSLDDNHQLNLALGL
jgi:hypothetical protein